MFSVNYEALPQEQKKALQNVTLPRNLLKPLSAALFQSLPETWVHIPRFAHLDTGFEFSTGYFTCGGTVQFRDILFEVYHDST